MAKTNDVYQLLNDFIQIEDKNNSSLRSELKRSYGFFRKEKRKKGNINEVVLDSLVRLIQKNYDKIKEFPEINEICSDIIEDYSYVKELNMDASDKVDTKIKNIHTYILGNPGTSSKGMDLDYIEDIIKEKIRDVDDILINRDDVLNILKEQSVPAIYGDFDRYQKLIEDVIMDSVENNLDSITNPKAIDVLKDLAISYKNQGNYEKSKEIYEKCLELYKKISNDSKAIEHEFTGVISEENEHLQEELDDVTDISKKINELLKDVSNGESEQDLTHKFLSLKANSLEELVNGLNGDVGFEKANKVKYGEDTPMQSKSKSNNNEARKNYVMPVQEKIEGIQKAIADLKLHIEKISVFRSIEEDKNSEIIRLAQETIKDYSEFVLINVKELNVSLLECLSTDQRYLQIIPNEKLYEILQFEKVRDQKLNGTINKKHTEGTFANNLTETLQMVQGCRKEGKPIKNEELGDKIEEENENKQVEETKGNKQQLLNELLELMNRRKEKNEELVLYKADKERLLATLRELEEIDKREKEINAELDKLK